MLITPPTIPAEEASTEPRTIRYKLGQIVQVMSGIIIKQGLGTENDLVETGTIILVSNPDGSISIEHSSIDIHVYPKSAKPEVKA